MRILLATDHAGYEMKEQVSAWLVSLGHSMIDCGATSLDADDSYVPIMRRCAERYGGLHDDEARMIVFGGSGTGEAIVMNRYAGIRAVVYNGQDIEIVRLGRAHNDANCLSVGARFVDFAACQQAIEIFLSTDFDGGRHAERVAALDFNNL